MDPQAPTDEAPPIRPFNWTWALIVAVWLLLFMIVLAVGAAVVFWRQATGAKYAVASITAEYQTLNDQLTASDAKAATLTKDRGALVDQLAATNKQLANLNNQLAAPNAAVVKLTSERNALADQLTNTNANIAKLTTERDTLAQKLTAAQATQVAAANPAPAPPPVVANPPVIPPVKVPPAFAPNPPVIPGVKMPAASETPLLRACMDLKKDPSDANWQRVLGLALALKNAIDKQLPAPPYDHPFDAAALLQQSNVNPRRPRMINQTRYVSTELPGPGWLYIRTSAVFLDGPMVADAPPGGPARRGGGYINNSVIVVNGKLATNSYISDSIVITTGPITVDSYISNSLVISLDSLPAIAAPLPAHANPDPAAPELTPTVSVNSYISKSVIIGVVSCKDLRDCNILGRVNGPEPNLRGAMIDSAVHVAPLLWQIDKPAALDH